MKLRNAAISSTHTVPDDDIGIETVLHMERLPRKFSLTVGSIAANSEHWTESWTDTTSAKYQQVLIQEDEQLPADSPLGSLKVERWYVVFDGIGLRYVTPFRDVTNTPACH